MKARLQSRRDTGPVWASAQSSSTHSSTSATAQPAHKRRENWFVLCNMQVLYPQPRAAAAPSATQPPLPWLANSRERSFDKPGYSYVPLAWSKEEAVHRHHTTARIYAMVLGGIAVEGHSGHSGHSEHSERNGFTLNTVSTVSSVSTVSTVSTVSAKGWLQTQWAQWAQRTVSTKGWL